MKKKLSNERKKSEQMLVAANKIKEECNKKNAYILHTLLQKDEYIKKLQNQISNLNKSQNISRITQPNLNFGDFTDNSKQQLSVIESLNQNMPNMFNLDSLQEDFANGIFNASGVPILSNLDMISNITSPRTNSVNCNSNGNNENANNSNGRAPNEAKQNATYTQSMVEQPQLPLSDKLPAKSSFQKEKEGAQ